MVFYHGLEDSSLGGGGGGQKKILILEHHRVGRGFQNMKGKIL